MDIMSLNQLGSLDNFGSITGIEGFGSLGSDQTVDTDNTYSFENALTDAIANVEETSQAVTEEAYKLATGQTDNLHDITIASTQANLAVSLFVQLRNKSVAAYQELMNLQI